MRINTQRLLGQICLGIMVFTSLSMIVISLIWAFVHAMLHYPSMTP